MHTHTVQTCLCVSCVTSFCVHGPRLRDVVEEMVRREVERCDRLSGLMVIMSVAGGTGSGVGTYVTQCLRDTYPKSFIVNHLTWPYGTGEVWTLLSVKRRLLNAGLEYVDL